MTASSIPTPFGVKFCKVVGLVLVHPLPFVAPFDVKFCKVVGLVSAGLHAGMVVLVGVCCRLHQ